jgi:hypothetical protein
MRHVPFTKLHKGTIHKSDPHTTISISLSHSIPNTKPLGHHRHQHLHDRSGRYIRIGGLMSSPSEWY